MEQDKHELRFAQCTRDILPAWTSFYQRGFQQERKEKRKRKLFTDYFVII